MIAGRAWCSQTHPDSPLQGGGAVFVIAVRGCLSALEMDGSPRDDGNLIPRCLTSGTLTRLCRTSFSLNVQGSQDTRPRQQ